MLYVKNKVLTLSFNCIPKFNIQIIDFIDGNINILNRKKYAYINCKCNLEILKNYINNTIITLNFHIDNVEYYNDIINGRLVYKESELKRDIIDGKLNMNEREYKDAVMDISLNLEKIRYGKNIIDGKLNMNEREYKSTIYGILFLQKNELNNDIVKVKLNVNERKYEKDYIDGSVNLKDRIYNGKYILGKFMYRKRNVEKDIMGKILIEKKMVNSDIECKISDIEQRKEEMDIDGKLNYVGESKLKRDIMVKIKDVKQNYIEKNIDVGFIYKKGEIKSDVLARLVMNKRKELKNYIEGRMDYKEGRKYIDIEGKLNYINDGYIRMFFDGRLVIDGKRYENNVIEGKLNLDEKRYKNNVIDGKLNLEEKCVEMIFPLRFKIKYKCYHYSIFGKVNVMREEKRDICCRVCIGDKNIYKDIECMANLSLYEFWNNTEEINNKKYIIPYERNIYNNEIMVKIRNVENDEIMEKCETDINVRVDVKECEKVEKDIDVRVDVKEIDIGNMVEYREKDVICKYYDMKDGLCLMGNKIKKCNNEILCGKIVNIVREEDRCNKGFEIECGKYDICRKCIMEYEKRKRNEKRKEKIYKRCLLGDVIERKNGKYNILYDNDVYNCYKKDDCVLSDITDINNDTLSSSSSSQKFNCVYSMLIYVDDLWVVEPYVFKSCLISILDRYYGKDLYVYYYGKERTNFDVMNLCLNYKISMEKIKKIEGDITSYIRMGFGGDIRKAYIFMNDPYNWKNVMNIKRIVNVCKYMNIDVVVIGNGGEYLILEGNDWKINETEKITISDDPVRITY